MANNSLIDTLVIHNDELVNYISYRFGDRQFAQEVVQETCIRVLQKTIQPEDIQSPMAFLRTVCMRVAIDCYRKEKSVNEWLDFCEIPQEIEISHYRRLTFPELQFAKQQREQILLKTIQQLPDSCRDVFILTQLYHYSQYEVAQQLQLSRGMVARYLAKAFKLMQPIILTHDE
ncbi:RNA polymerase sigma factor [Acinetobacter qingfengensis]|uniref:RNA polymerase sigma factor n=1 Tax=Acinetobacter qingfengensis TaxID=1262585 RepID=A0A1E7R517_9GAMM|nr:RNA polymerase sigma factor [Acinetobacter qingfengensis]KAA8732464.1 RNA polymerase sigma factor [Acinetobacter qingfengensis]OEY94459.1 hypothetical protein BJI46_03710 [Acinetobacter qingfengensis]